MKITKYDHSSIIIEKDDFSIIIDPVEYTTKIPDYRNVKAFIITHLHSDHYQPVAFGRLLSLNPSAPIFTPDDNAPNIPNPTIVNDGQSTQIDTFHLSFYGENHASIVDDHIPCQNISVIIDNKIVHPGDSLLTPPLQSPQLLFAPLAAPWCKASEVVDYINTIKPQHVIPIHDAILSSLGQEFYHNILQTNCPDVAFHFLTPGESFTL